MYYGCSRSATRLLIFRIPGAFSFAHGLLQIKYTLQSVATAANNALAHGMHCTTTECASAYVDQRQLQTSSNAPNCVLACPHHNSCRALWHVDFGREGQVCILVDLVFEQDFSVNLNAKAGASRQVRNAVFNPDGLHEQPLPEWMRRLVVLEHWLVGIHGRHWVWQD